MLQAYRVKLIKGHKAKKADNIDGYLGNAFGDGEICIYATRAVAINKARLFKGTIEPFGKKYDIDKDEFAQIYKSNLSLELQGILENIHHYHSTDNHVLTAKFYAGNVFGLIVHPEEENEVIEGLSEDCKLECRILDTLVGDCMYFQLLAG